MVKAPWTRVLELTWGWYQFVENEESREEEPLSDDRLSSEELFDLYQTAGGQAFDEPEGADVSEVIEKELKAFLNDKILPLLLRR